MYITKCDRCKTDMTDGTQRLRVETQEPYHLFHLCKACSKPVLAALKKLKLFK
jgi:RNase P subunit RPR2